MEAPPPPLPLSTRRRCAGLRRRLSGLPPPPLPSPVLHHAPPSPTCAPLPTTTCSQVELLGSDMLQLLPQHAEGGPHHRVQVPALLHQVVHHRGAAVRGVHLVSRLHAGDHLFQRLGGEGRGEGRRKAGREFKSATISNGEPFHQQLSPVRQRPGDQVCHLLAHLGHCRTGLTYNSGVRHAPKGVDLPQEDPVAPHVRLGGKPLLQETFQEEKEKRCICKG